ncbi:MAG: hypothetical protein ACO3A4_10735 [Silvanigrellaceae bacterium]
MGSSTPESASIWTTDLSPQAFFHEKVQEAQSRQGIMLSENVEFYIVNLLCDYVRVDEGKLTDECLALMLKKALESPSGEQIFLYKKLADTALYFSGFFQEYFNNKCFDISYYVMMGEGAYGQLSSLMRKRTASEAAMSEIYGEMASSFGTAVDIITDVSESTSGLESQRSTLSLYDAWLSTTSRKLAKDLNKRGINPVRVSKKAVQ